MTLAVLGVLVLAGILGPLLALPKRISAPVAVGEIFVGMLLGKTGFSIVPTNDSTLTLFSSVGFALVMFTAGSHINLGAFRNAGVLRRTLKILLLNGVCAVGVGRMIGSFSGIKNWSLLAIVVFSSSAAFIVPLVASRQAKQEISVLIAQVTMADILSFTILPVLFQKHNKWSAFAGSLAILVIAYVIFRGLKRANDKGWILRIHTISKTGNFGLELRISLGVLLALSALAVKFHSSILIAGFSLGVVLAAVGVPRRLARQLFALSDGFFAPIFFVILGASIDLGSTFQDSKSAMLVFLLIAGTIVVHILPVVFKESAKFSLASIAQMGIPAAVVTLGMSNEMLTRGESGAIMVSALATLLISSQVLKVKEIVK